MLSTWPRRWMFRVRQKMAVRLCQPAKADLLFGFRKNPATLLGGMPVRLGAGGVMGLAVCGHDRRKPRHPRGSRIGVFTRNVLNGNVLEPALDIVVRECRRAPPPRR